MDIHGVINGVINVFARLFNESQLTFAIGLEIGIVDRSFIVVLIRAVN